VNLFDLFFGSVKRKKVRRKKVWGIKAPDIEQTRKEAKKILPKRLQELAQKHGFSYKRLAVRNARTRWGSCSHANNINLNMHLIKLDNDLIDYVILHELCHTIEKNHSQRFWVLLEKHMPDFKERRRRLKNTVL
jgi:predicted metal-dependent hydrolase